MHSLGLLKRTHHMVMTLSALAVADLLDLVAVADLGLDALDVFDTLLSSFQSCLLVFLRRFLSSTAARQ